MRLKEFYERYKAERRPDDFITIKYADPGTGEERYIHKYETTPEQWGLLMEADIIRSRIYDTEWTNPMGPGRGVCRNWHAEIDGDQAQIALGTHPALRERPGRENAEIGAKAKAGTRAGTGRPKSKTAARRRRRFVL